MSPSSPAAQPPLDPAACAALSRIEVAQGDITALAVDAIVNAANEALAGGGGVDGAIHAAAGRELGHACHALPEVLPGVRCPTGEARITAGFRLPARHVIHTVGPVWQGGERGEPGLLAACYQRSLELAARHGIASLAFPAISTGVFGYPAPAAASVAVAALARGLAVAPTIRRVLLVAFGEPSAQVLRAALQAADSPEVALARAWVAASNAADAERAMALCAPDLTLVGPRGAQRGRELLVAWLARASATFEPLRIFQHGPRVVMEQRGLWRTPAGDVQGEAIVATLFSLRAGAISHIQRHETLAEALREAGLDPASDQA